MRFTTTAELTYDVTGTTRFFVHLRALRTAEQQVLEETLHIEPEPPLILSEENASAEGHPLIFEATGNVTASYRGVVECTPPTRTVSELATWAPAPLRSGLLRYLFPSRYCESDQLGRLAWQTFGQQPGPYATAAAVADWIFKHLTYERGTTDATTSACTVLVRRAGVCRDFAHLGVALCRALNLPARYVTGYAHGLEPPDMHAWFEVAIGEHWVPFDATRLAPLVGFVKVAHGLDAADTSLVSTFGPANARSMTYTCLPADESVKQSLAVNPATDAVPVTLL